MLVLEMIFSPILNFLDMEYTPTHKAKESLQKKLDKGTVQTIHSYVHGESEAKVVVVDESGMLSTKLMNSLLRMGNKSTQYIFVGDKGQKETNHHW